MNEHSVQVVISGAEEQHVRLRVHGAAPDRPVVVQVASLCPPGTVRPEEPARDARATLRAAPAISLELRWSEPAPPPAPRSEPAPLATAWALAQRIRERQPRNRRA
jgi:hypothetical protein